MLLTKNTLIQLDYDTKTDTLTIDWPAIRAFALPEVQHTFKLIVDTLKYYDIKRLLIDARHSVVEVSEADYQAIIFDFALSLNTTRVLKVARIEACQPQQPAQAKQFTSLLQDARLFAWSCRNFKEKQAAINWLIEA